MPYALKRILKYSYRRLCHIIVEKGGNHHAVTLPVLEKVLKDLAGVKKSIVFRRKPWFEDWRQGKKGTWVVTVVSPFTKSAHCIALKDGQGLDNGWTNDFMLSGLKVQSAHQLEVT